MSVSPEQPLVFHALYEPLQQVLAETVSPPDPKEKLSWRTFVGVVVYYFVAGIKSGRLLLTHLPHAPAELGLPTGLKKATFFEAFRRFSPSRSRELFSQLLARLSFFPVPEMASLGRLCAVDGSHWPTLFRMHWTLAGPNKPTALLHVAFGLNQMIPVATLLTESTFSERTALKQMLQPAVTYIADRGYFAYYLLRDIAAGGAFFVIRAPCSVTSQVLQDLPVNLPGGVSWLLAVQDQKVHCDKGEDGQDSGTWRVVRFVIGDSTFILFTNRWDLTTWQIITIYAYRWQIELLFLFIKRTLNGLHLLTQGKGGLQIQFDLMLTAALLLLHFKQRNEQAVGKNPDPPVETVRTPRPAEPTDDRVQVRDGTCGPGQVEVRDGTCGPGQAPPEPLSPAPPATRERSQTPIASAPVIALTPDSPMKPETQTPQPARRPPQRFTAGENPTRPTVEQPRPRSGTVASGENSTWYQGLGKKMATFWRIGKHWLEVLRLNLAKVWNPAVFQLLPGSQ
jgi:hypothetical protein